jgi:uroporphyrinogen decarboxylase
MKLTRRGFLAASAAPAVLRGAAMMTHRQRVDAAIAGRKPDQPPISLWNHFGLEQEGPEAHARRTLEFHRDASTDLVKVMSDFPFPRPAGQWYEIKVLSSPFAPQLKALEIIRKELGRSAHFIETIFNPWNVAEKLSSPSEVRRLMREQPQRLLDALEAIARSEANHARQALRRGASGIFLAIANAQDGLMTREEYAKFSEPFDRMVVDAAGSAPLNVLHLHGEKVWVEYFLRSPWKVTAVNWSMHETRYSIRLARFHRKSIAGGVVLGGIDHRNYRTRTVAELTQDIRFAMNDAAPKLIVSPGCSIPDDTTTEEIKKLAAAAAAAAA